MSDPFEDAGRIKARLEFCKLLLDQNPFALSPAALSHWITDAQAFVDMAKADLLDALAETDRRKAAQKKRRARRLG